MKWNYILFAAVIFVITLPSYGAPDTQKLTHEPFLLEIYVCDELDMVVGSWPEAGAYIIARKQDLTYEAIVVMSLIKKEAKKHNKWLSHHVSGCV